METWARAHVIVDVASVAHAIGDARNGGGRIQPRLDLVRRELERFGIETLSFTVAVPTLPVACWSRPSDEWNRAERTEEAREWVAVESRRAGVPLHVAAGGEDGRGEVGVDEAAVVQTLAQEHACEDGAVFVIVTNDVDVPVLAEYLDGARGTRAFVVGHERRLGKERRNELNRCGIGWIRLTDDDYARMAEGRAPEPKVIVVAERDGASKLVDAAHSVRSSPLDTALRPAASATRLAEGAATIVVVDSLGLMNVAARSIGAGRLPTCESVEDVLRELGFDGPFAHWFVLPDVVDGELHPPLTDAQRAAWRDENRGYGEAARELAADGDERTSAVRSQLRPGRTREVRPGVRVLTHDPRRRYVEEKRASAVMVADVVHATLHHPEATVVVLSDRPEVELTLSRLDEVDLDIANIVRVGTHAAPITELDPFEDPRNGRHHVVELTPDQLARVARVDDLATASVYRRKLREATERVGVTWRVVRTDAFASGIVVASEEVPDLELTLTGYLAVLSSSLEAVRSDGIALTDDQRLVLEYDRHAPCELPAVELGREESELIRGRVLAVGAGGPQIDIDDDGVPDDVAVVGHESRPLRVGEPVHLLSEQGTLVLVGREWQSDETADTEVVEVLRAEGRLVARSVEEGIQGPLEVRAGLDLHDLPVGCRVLAHRLPGGGFRATSTPLPHLQEAAAAATGVSHAEG